MHVLIPKLNAYQRYNHFPCTWQLGRKDNLWENFKRMKINFPEDYTFIPETYILPGELSDFIKNFEEKKNVKNWIIKPVASSRGRGIKLLTNINKIPARCLISQYIGNPHLIEKKKYDLRLYVLITSYSPLKIYLYNEGLVRFASEDYEYNSEILDEYNYNKFMHLTNYSVNKSSENFDKNISTDNECIGSKWSLSALRVFFKENNFNFEEMWRKIKDIVIKAIISSADLTIETVRNLTDKRNNLFELYGFDILIDNDLTPWLLEINLNPSLNCDTELDSKIKTTLMTDILNVIGLVPYNHLENRNYMKENEGIFMNENPTTLEEDYNTYYRNYSILNNLPKKNYEEKEKIFEIVNDKKMGVYDNLKGKFDEDIKKVNMKIFIENFPEDYLSEEINRYTNEEFGRMKNFSILFPLKDNVEYYSNFLSKPEIENILLWSLIKGNFINFP